eukprot:gene21105-biopygen7136
MPVSSGQGQFPPWLGSGHGYGYGHGNGNGNGNWNGLAVFLVLWRFLRPVRNNKCKLVHGVRIWVGGRPKVEAQYRLFIIHQGHGLHALTSGLRIAVLRLKGGIRMDDGAVPVPDQISSVTPWQQRDFGLEVTKNPEKAITSTLSNQPSSQVTPNNIALSY